MLTEDRLSPLILREYDVGGLSVDELSRLVAIGLGESLAITLHIVVVDMG